MAQVVFLSHTPRESFFRVGSHHLSAALAAAGHDVVHISTPFSFLHRVARPGQAARSLASKEGPKEVEGVVDLVPRTVLPADFGWSGRSMRKALQLTGISQPNYVFIDQPLFGVKGLDGATIIFRPTDVFKEGRWQRAALKLSSQANGVAATSPGVLDSVGVKGQVPATVIENGVEFRRFSAVRGLAREYDFVYVGALDGRFDFSALRSAATLLPHCSFVLFGPISAPVEDMPNNVHLRGPINYEEVPRAVAAARVALLPLIPNSSNRARSPMKLYEYVAAGAPLIAPDFLLERVDQLDGAISYPPNEPFAFADACRRMLDMELSVSDLDGHKAQRRDWSNIAGELFEFAARCKSAA